MKVKSSTLWQSVRRWVLRGTIAVVALVLLILATVPFWMGTALRLALPEDSVSFEDYERIGYGRFALQEVRVDTPQAVVLVDRIESLTPLVWLWRAYQREFPEPFARAGEVRLELKETAPDNNEADSSGPANLFEALELARGPLVAASSWAPYVTVDSVRIAFGERLAEFRNIVWRESALEFHASYDQFSEYELAVVAKLHPTGAVLSIKSDKAELNIQGRLNLENDFANFVMEVDLKEDHLEADGRFDRSGWLPVDASWTAKEWTIVSSDYGIGGPYEEYGFSVVGEWKNGAYQNALTGRAVPGANDGFELPPLDFEGTVTGTEDRFSVEGFRLSGPGVEARTVEPISLALGKLELAGEVKFDIDFDLSLLKMESLNGVLSGEAFLMADEAGAPRGRFNLSGAGVEYENLKSEIFKIEARLEWPHVRIESLDILLETGSRIDANGGVNITSRTIAPSSVEIDVSEQVLEKVVPEGFVLKEVKSTAKIEGPFSAIEHSGSLSIGFFEMDALKPLRANASWVGRNQVLDRFSIDASNEEARIDLLGKGSLESNQVKVDLSALRLEKDGQTLANLANPSQISLSLGEPLTGSVNGFALVGREAKLMLETEFSFPRKANTTLSLEGLDTMAWVDPWLKEPVPFAQINRLNLTASWNDGPVEAKGVLDAAVQIDESELSMDGEITLSDQSIVLNAFAISDIEGPLMQLEGTLPYQVNTNVEGYVVADTAASLVFSLETSESPTIIGLLNTVSPVEIDSLQAKAHLGGTLSKPEGSIDLNLSTKEGEGEYGAPSTRISALAKIDGPNAKIDRMSVQMLKQVFEASLEVQLPEEALQWGALKRPEVDWRRTQLDFSSPKTSLAPIAFFAPQLLTPSGTFESRFTGSPMDGFSGFVSIDSLSTRPVFPFGSFRNVQTRLKIDHTTATLETFKGDIGREPVSMAGEIDFQNLEDLVFELAIKGGNLPILRQAGLLLRSDLDIVAKKSSGKAAQIDGEILLKEGLFLLDTTALRSSGGGQSAKTRPPYFSVEVPQFSDWGLEVSVKGDQFMRVQTPAATGVLSVDMDLKGTLKEPRAVGRVEFDKGSLIFPFATFDLTEGLIELRVDDPYTPVLSLLGEGRRFRYDLGIEILGSAFDPRIRFTSSPPLSSEQILLMVMAGDVPDESFNYTASQRASIIGTYLSQGILSSGGGTGLGSRISLVTGQNLSEQGKETLEMEFVLDDQFQLLGEYDEYDAWNAGIRWRAVRRKAKKSEEQVIREVSE